MKSVTSDMVRIWRKEADQLRQELTELERRIEAARVLDLVVDDDDTSIVDEREEPVPDAILRAISDSPHEWTYPGPLKRWLTTRGFNHERFGQNGNYFYTSLKRLVERKLIEKDVKGRYRLISQS